MTTVVDTYSSSTLDYNKNIFCLPSCMTFLPIWFGIELPAAHNLVWLYFCTFLRLWCGCLIIVRGFHTRGKTSKAARSSYLPSLFLCYFFMTSTSARDSYKTGSGFAIHGINNRQTHVLCDWFVTVVCCFTFHIINKYRFWIIFCGESGLFVFLFLCFQFVLLFFGFYIFRWEQDVCHH